MITAARLFLLVLCAGVLFGACDSGSTEVATELDEARLSKFSAEFASFYTRFHEDSTFQSEHIAWPLDGNLQMGEAGDLVDVKWQAEDWRMHKPLSLGSAYVQEVDNSQPDLVIERVRTTEGAYMIERRFAKLGSDWWLIYYRVADVG